MDKIPGPDYQNSYKNYNKYRKDYLDDSDLVNILKIERENMVQTEYKWMEQIVVIKKIHQDIILKPSDINLFECPQLFERR